MLRYITWLFIEINAKTIILYRGCWPGVGEIYVRQSSAQPWPLENDEACCHPGDAPAVSFILTQRVWASNPHSKRTRCHHLGLPSKSPLITAQFYEVFGAGLTANEVRALGWPSSAIICPADILLDNPPDDGERGWPVCIWSGFSGKSGTGYHVSISSTGTQSATNNTGSLFVFIWYFRPINWNTSGLMQKKLF